MIARHLTPARYELLGQLVRYGVTGGAVTMLYAVVYTAVAAAPVPLPRGLHLQSANLAGYLVAMGVGFVLHSRWSFRGRETRDGLGTGGRFFAVSLFSLALNAGWTWLLATRLGWERHTPLIPIVCVTPLLVFGLQRRWVFR